MSGFSEQNVGQYIVSSNPIMDNDQLSGRVELFNEDGSPYSAQKKTVTVPYAWILANSMSEASFEVLSDIPGERLGLLGAFGTLRFGSRPYQGDFETYPYLISNDPISGQQGFSPWAYSTAGGIWEATEDVSFQFRTLAYHVDTPEDLGSVSLFFQGSGLTNGDSDLDITLFYMSFKVPG
jgi:hypothetical protein